MADTQVKSASAEDHKKHLMKVFKDLTKDCEDMRLRRMFDTVKDYDGLNACAIRLFSVLADKGLLDEARELFKPLPEQTTLPEVFVFTFVMVGLMAFPCTGNHRDAHKVYQQMISSGVTPTTYTYYVLIGGFSTDFSDSNFLVYAKKYFLEMLDRGMKPHFQIYIDAMGAVSYKEPLEEIKNFLEQIKAKGYVPVLKDFRFNEYHLTKALRGFIIVNITDKAVKKFFLDESQTSCWIQRAMEMLKALVDDGNVDEALELSHTIQQKGIEPLVLLHTSLITAYLKFGKTKGALDAYLAMLAAEVAPNSYTYTVLIKGLAADPVFFRDAKKYLLEMMDKGKRPNAATYTAVIEGFARKEDSAAEDEGKEFVGVMMCKGFVPNAKAMREVLKGKPIPVIQRIINIVLSKLKG